MLDSLSPARRRLVLVVSGLIAALVVVIAAVTVIARDPPVEPAEQDVLGPVVLVPGYGGNGRSLSELESALQDAGRDVTILRLSGDGRGDLAVQAEVLEDAVDVALERTGAESVDVVGYSAGGLVARLWVKEYGGDALARRVVTLGSPHHGTELAGYASDISADSCPAACEQMAPDSSFLRRLNAQDETPDGPLWVSIWTADDTVVSPPSSARLDGALNFVIQDVCPRNGELTHSDLPSDPAVIASVIVEVDRAEPALPVAGDCRA